MDSYVCVHLLVGRQEALSSESLCFTLKGTVHVVAIEGDERGKTAKGNLMFCALSRSARVWLQSITAELEHLYLVLPAQGGACRPKVVPDYKCMHQL